MPQLCTACVIVALMPATSTVPPLFMLMVFSTPCMPSHAAVSGMATHGAIEPFRERHRVGDVIEVAVRDEDRVERIRPLELGRTHRILFQKGIDHDVFAARRLHRERRVPAKCDFQRAEIHAAGFVSTRGFPYRC